MKVTKEMIDAGCKEAPRLERNQVTKIIQAAQAASIADSKSMPIWQGIVGAAFMSGIVTVLLLIGSLFASGTWLDPRVWSGKYVSENTMTSALENGAWIIGAATSSAPYVFSVAWFVLSLLFIVSRRFNKQ